MQLREIAMTNFVLLQDTWTTANCLVLMNHLKSSHAIIQKEGMPDQYYLFKSSYLSQLLAAASHTASLAEALATIACTAIPALESDSEAEDAPDQCIVLEAGHPVGFFDVSIPPDRETFRGGHGAGGKARSESMPPSLIIDVPEKVPLERAVSVLVWLSAEPLSEMSAVLSLILPFGAVVEVVMRAWKGLVIEGDAEGQLVVSDQKETLPLQFKLRGVEPGPGQIRIFVFHNRKPLGSLCLRVTVLSTFEVSGNDSRGKEYMLQPLRLSHPELSLLIFEYKLRGQTDSPFQLSRQAPISGFNTRWGDPMRLGMSLTDTYPEVLWQGCQPEQLVLHLPIDQEYVEADTPLQNLVANELRDLLVRLFASTRNILVEALVPGFSGARVLKIRPFFAERGGGRSVVVKFGNVDVIKREYENYTNYVQPFIGDGRNTSAFNYQQTAHLGGILYSLLGTDIQQTQDFGVFYQQKGFSQIQQVLDNLFRHTCELWYANITSLQPLNLTEDYQWQGGEAAEKVGRMVAELLSTTVQFRQNLTFQSFKKTPGRNFTNPFLFLNTAQMLIRSTYVCTTHGDLNQHNILIDPMGYPWLIDFQSTCPGHILRDVATLDVVVRFQLLSAQQATLDEFLSMEEALCAIKHFSQLENLKTSYTTDNPALARVYQTVMHLRTLAGWLVEKNPADDMSEYYIALLYITLDTVQFFSLEIEQRERALLSISLLVDLLGLSKT